jgi:hypothetical protein
MASDEESLVGTEEGRKYTMCEKVWPTSYFLIGGIGNAVVMKIAVVLEAPGNDGVIKPFQKPWFLSTIIFVAMFCALPVYMGRSYWAHYHGDESYFLVHRLSLKAFCEFAIPAFSDMFEQIIASVCIVFVGVSIDSMMKAGTLAGVCLINRFILKRRYKPYQWVGIWGIMLALTLVGAAPVLAAEKSITIHVSAGIVAVIVVLKWVSQVGYGVKIAYEEHMSQELGYPEDMIVGVEGLWSALMCVVCQIIAQFMPGEEGNGIREDSVETFLMMRNSWRVCIIVVVSFFLGISYNMISTVLINRTSALTRTLVESFRTILIWAVQFMIFYGSGDSHWRMAGEHWTNSGFIQAGGFLLMTASILTYNKWPKWPCFDYTEEDGEDEEAEEAPAGEANGDSDGETSTNFIERTMTEKDGRVGSDDEAPSDLSVASEVVQDSEVE